MYQGDGGNMSSLEYNDWFDETTSKRCPYLCEIGDNHSIVEHEPFIKSWRKNLGTEKLPKPFTSK